MLPCSGLSRTGALIIHFAGGTSIYALCWHGSHLQSNGLMPGTALSVMNLRPLGLLLFCMIEPAWQQSSCLSVQVAASTSRNAHTVFGFLQ